MPMIAIEEVIQAMLWMNRLYVGERAEKKREEILSGIREGRLQMGVYVLTLASHPDNQLDIYPSNVLLQPYYKKKEDLTVVGIARGREEALLLVSQITTEAYRAYGTPDLRRYLAKRMEEDGDA